MKIEIIEDLEMMMLSLISCVLIFRYGLKKSLKNNGGLFYEKAIVLLFICSVLSLISLINIILSIMDM
jgi:hypothetical protein